MDYGKIILNVLLSNCHGSFRALGKKTDSLFAGAYLGGGMKKSIRSGKMKKLFVLILLLTVIAAITPAHNSRLSL